jgi:hypothetical protein
MSKTTTATRPAAAKTTKVAAATGAKTRAAQPLRTEEESSTDALMRNFLNAKEALFKQLKAPGWKRMVMGAIAVIAVSAGVGWVCGFAIDWLTLGVLTLTGSAYAGLAVWLLGIIMMCFAAGKLAAKAWDSVVSGRADEAISDSFAWVKGKLGFGDRFDALWDEEMHRA